MTFWVTNYSIEECMFFFDRSIIYTLYIGDDIGQERDHKLVIFPHSVAFFKEREICGKNGGSAQAGMF